MFVMVVSFVGGGISEFVDASWIQPRLVNGVPTVSLLGIYPYAESLIAQGIAVAVIVLTLVTGSLLKKNKKTAQ